MPPGINIDCSQQMNRSAFTNLQISRQLLDCASPLALFGQRQKTAALQNATAPAGVSRYGNTFWTAPVLWRFSSCVLPLGCRLEIIRNMHPINLETINGFDHRGRGGTLEPSRRTPRILVGHGYQTVFHRVLMNIVQPGQIGLLVSKPCFAKVEPHLPSSRSIELVYPLSRLHMEHAKHIGKVRSIGCLRWRMGDEMVMVRENGPSLELPTILTCYCQQAPMQNGQAVCAAEIMGFKICTGGDEVSPPHGQPVCRGVWPRCPGFSHQLRMAKTSDHVEPLQTAAEDCRTPKRYRVSRGISIWQHLLDCASPLALLATIHTT